VVNRASHDTSGFIHPILLITDMPVVSWLIVFTNLRVRSCIRNTMMKLFYITDMLRVPCRAVS